MNIIVTGASMGIGRELVRRFSSDKLHQVYAVARHKKRLREIESPSVRILPFDLEDLEGIESELAVRIGEMTESIDILVNNAGYLAKMPVKDMKTEEAERMMRVNLYAPMLLVRSLMPLLSNAEHPHVVNIGSMAGVAGAKKFTGLSIYSASKAALHILTECLAEEYRDSGVHFNALALGSVDTDMLRKAFPTLRNPMGASDMAAYIYDFALNGWRYFNGKIIPVSYSSP